MHNNCAGDLAKTTSPQEVGRATGELCAAMAKVDLGDTVIPIPPYFKVFDVHHAINKDRFYQDAATNPAFEVSDRTLQVHTKHSDICSGHIAVCHVLACD